MNSLLQTLLSRATTPLVPQVGQAADAGADIITTPKLDESPTVAKLKGFGAGALSGAGHLISDMTSPMSLTGLLSSGGVGSRLLSMAGNSGLSSVAGMAIAKPNLPADLIPPGGELGYNALRQVPKITDPMEQTYLRILSKGGR